MAKKKRINLNLLLTSILYIIIGLLFCIFRDSILNIVFTIAGALFIAIGIIILTQGDEISGIINISIGAFIIIGAWLFLKPILVICGAYIFIKSIVALISNHGSHSINEIAINSFTALAGLALAICTWVTIGWFFIIVGILFILDGAIDCIYTIKQNVR